MVRMHQELWSSARSLGAIGCSSFLPRSQLAQLPWRPAPAAITWGREIGKLGHVVRVIAPDYVKPFVKRQKNDAADAEAICEATQRPTMRFVAVKGEEQQAGAVVFRARDLLVRQRTQIINAIRGHLAEFGMVVAKGPLHVAKLVAAIEDNHSGIPAMARPILRLLADQLRSLDERVVLLDRELARRAKEDAEAKRLATIPGIGPITATALVALAPPAQAFKRGRDFAAWPGLTPLQRSTGGKQKLGETSRKGERTLRRLLIIGASATVRWAMRKGSTTQPWLARMLNRKSPMLVIGVALRRADRALRHRRTDQWRKLPRLCRAGSRPHSQSRRDCRHGHVFPVGARRIFSKGTDRGRALTCVRPLLRLVTCRRPVRSEF
jgi:transposase